MFADALTFDACVAALRRYSFVKVERDALSMHRLVQLVTRERILDRVWGLSFPGGTRTVDVHVGQLRRKLERPELIRTVRGAGYKLVAQ